MKVADVMKKEVVKVASGVALVHNLVDTRASILASLFKVLKLLPRREVVKELMGFS